ncbi:MULTISPECIES: M56 family metallopeptidase [Anaerotignum]|uniref:M56 family metallopeptidase n=1 Tax=Anaerotignum TaxID=2039240 RepID=UPI0021097DA9|nr:MULTISPECIES: M56 family metallopeptidase [Anaerotignum]MCQ4934989.1 M56 family metallopeptidase [Anaerotignum propionicum]
MYLFQSVIKISVFSSIAIICLGVLSHFIGKQYGVKWRYFVWLIIGLRLIVPIDITLPRPVVEIPRIQTKAEATYASKTYPLEKDKPSELSVPVEKQIGKNMEIQSTQTTGTSIDMEKLQNKIWIFWIFGMIIYFLYQIVKYQRFLRDLNRNSRSIRDAEVLEVYYDVCREMEMKQRPEIYFCGILTSSLCTGFFHQRIYLNHEEYARNQLQFILKHELVHCKRRDVWYKGVLVIAKGIHFFNPFVHWMGLKAEQDLEYSCDSLVLQKCSLVQRQDYGLTILDTIRQGGHKSPFSTAFYGGKEALKVRIDYIFDMRKKKRGIPLFLALLFIVWFGTAFVGCGKNHENQEKEEIVDSVAMLYECKLDYIGNHIGVGAILGKLTLPEGIRPSSEGIELFTKEEPFGVRQYLTLENGMEIPKDGWFERDAMIFLALVDNASFFEYAIIDENGEEQILHFDREDGSKYFGETDLRTMTTDIEAFRGFMKELDQLYPDNNQINLLLDEIVDEMGNSFSYEALGKNEKYEEMLKLGDGALAELLSQFYQGQAADTRGYIMMATCLKLLNTPEATISNLLKEMTPSQWFKAYCALDSVVVEPFVYDEKRYGEGLEKRGLLSMKDKTQQGLITRHSDINKALYVAMERHYSEDSNEGEVQIVAPLISHITQDKDKLSVYAVIGLNKYAFIRTPNLGYQLVEGGGSYIPSRLDFEWKNKEWTLVEWVEAKDGSYHAPSIEEMCQGANAEVAKDLISYDRRELSMLLKQNLIFYLNGRTDITVYHTSNMDETDIKEIQKYISFIQN